MRKPLPLGEVALQSNDGEGKLVSQKHPHSDTHRLLSERCYIAVFLFFCSILALSVTFGDSSPKGRATGVPGNSALTAEGSIWHKR